MSIIFGVRRSKHEFATEPELCQMSLATTRYAPDGTYLRLSGRIGMGYQPYHTHARSKLDFQPIQDPYGNILVFDGRLDNYEDLWEALDLIGPNPSDPSIILAAFSHWGEYCFSKFIGEWALALWSAKDDLVYLARDHAGTRTLYFSNGCGTLRWSTFLEILIDSEKTPAVDRDYISGYIASRPLAYLTPYTGVYAVAPAQYIKFRDNHLAKQCYWEASAGKHLNLKSDTEYVDGFLSCLGQSVARRTGSGAPIAAHLSGGMDSTSIVCMSDRLRSSMNPSMPLLDTISFYDDSERSWNEKPFFSAVEVQRGKIGVHIPTSLCNQSFLPAGGAYGTYLLPGADSSTIEMESIVKSVIEDHGYRVILSGIGGDEVLGGNPDHFPELACLLTERDFHTLVRKALEWSAVKRTTLIHMLLKTVSFTATLYRHPSNAYETEPPSWIQVNRYLLEEEEKGLRFRADDTPNDICNRLAWRSALETLPTLLPEYLSRYEYRYPLLDRDLVEYTFSIPRDQLTRPGRRRYLMRRALTGIVPIQVLERKRKAFVARSPLVALRVASEAGRSALRGALAAELGLIDQPKFQAALELTLRAQDLRWQSAVTRTINIELWLQALLGKASKEYHPSLTTIPHWTASATKIRGNAVT
jgi:asparagine synthase (glutamine-hydrolysing)